MQGNPKVLSTLNEVLTAELTSINQYFLHARIYKNWGLKVLNDVCYKKSIKDMKQADELIERILMLEGLPNLQALGKLRIGEDVAEIVDCDVQLENNKFDIITDAITLCEQKQDYVSRKLLLSLKDGNEEYQDWLDTQQDLIRAVGIENYIQSHIDD